MGNTGDDYLPWGPRDKAHREVFTTERITAQFTPRDDLQRVAEAIARAEGHTIKSPTSVYYIMARAAIDAMNRP